MNNLTHSIDYVLVSDFCVAVPKNFVFLARCPAGAYFGRPGITRKMLIDSIMSETEGRE